MNITFEPLNEGHLSLMLKWLKAPHVKKWWDEDIDYTLDLVKSKYGSYIQGYKHANGVKKSIRAYIINVEQGPVGYIQIYNAYDFSHRKTLFGLPEKLGAFDILIGEEKYLGKNIGSQAITKFLSLYGNKYPYVFAAPNSDNVVAIKAYEKADFKKFSEQKDVNEIWMLWERPQALP